MDFFIKKIFENNVGKDNLVHLQFQKFSRGEFKNRAIVIAKNSKNKYSISTTAEYANEFVRTLAEKLGNNKTRVTGVIISTRDLDKEIDFENKKQFMGIKQYVINNEMNGNEILDLCNKFPLSFLGLSFNINGNELKIKQKAPKSAKPSSKGEEKISADFCKLKTSDKEILKGLIFDSEINLDFKEIEISHDFIVNEIVITDEIKKEAGENYSKLRELSLRKGKIIRKIKVDGKEFVKEKEFEI